MNKTKYEILIDFEAVPPNFSSIFGSINKEFRKQKIKDLPFCYTIGLVSQNKKTKTRSHISQLKFLTKKEAFDDYFAHLKKILTNDIHILIGKKIDITKENIKFIGWGPSLESSITQKLFNLKTYAVEEFPYSSISLDKLIPKNLFSNNYFPKIKQSEISKKFKSVFAIKEDYSNGRIAGILGALLYINGSLQNSSLISKKLTKTEIEIIQKETIFYNRDDVLKLGYLIQNKEKSLKVVEAIKVIRKNKSKIVSKINYNNNILNTTKNIIEQKLVISDNIVDLIQYLNNYLNSNKENEEQEMQKTLNKYKRVLFEINEIIKENKFKTISNFISDLIKKINFYKKEKEELDLLELNQVDLMN
ncbi:hypothetical protein [Mycoplasma leonicaptivi]|uniref:hypothetical protein n=1 Tax=Mycoplasma leonicaptivi TaxID=36742 RepID=UPI0004891F65|nr:hypothetical protein [Mycoplasma leonicaptivi]